MATMEELKRLYQAYDRKVQDVKSKTSGFAGAFNMGDDPRRHSCHEEFYEAVGAWVESFLEEDPTAQQAAEALQWLLEAAAENRGRDVYWYMYAAQSHGKGLIPLVSRETCESLMQWYDRTYPALDRLPAQQEIFKLLRKGTGREEKIFRSWKLPFGKRK